MSDDARVPDPLLRHDYGERLFRAAEDFLVTAFEDPRPAGLLTEAPITPGLLACAMHVLCRTAWQQPSDEQVKASVFLSRRPADDGDGDGEEEEAEEEE